MSGKKFNEKVSRVENKLFILSWQKQSKVVLMFSLVPKLLLGNSYVSSCLGGVDLSMHSQSGDLERGRNINEERKTKIDKPFFYLS
jgi:hypothetical protein